MVDAVEAAQLGVVAGEQPEPGDRCVVEGKPAGCLPHDLTGSPAQLSRAEQGRREQRANGAMADKHDAVLRLEVAAHPVRQFPGTLDGHL